MLPSKERKGDVSAVIKFHIGRGLGEKNMTHHVVGEDDDHVWSTLGLSRSLSTGGLLWHSEGSSIEPQTKVRIEVDAVVQSVWVAEVAVVEVLSHSRAQQQKN